MSLLCLCLPRAELSAPPQVSSASILQKVTPGRVWDGADGAKPESALCLRGGWAALVAPWPGLSGLCCAQGCFSLLVSTGSGVLESLPELLSSSDPGELWVLHLPSRPKAAPGMLLQLHPSGWPAQRQECGCCPSRAWGEPGEAAQSCWSFPEAFPALAEAARSNLRG